VPAGGGGGGGGATAVATHIFLHIIRRRGEDEGFLSFILSFVIFFVGGISHWDRTGWGARGTCNVPP